MKKSIVLLLAAVLVGSVAYASSMRTISVPFTQKGEQVHPLYSGAKYARQATTAEAVIVSGPAVLLGLYMATGALANYVILRDTGTADGAGTKVFGNLMFSPTLHTSPNQIPFPVRFSNGISLQLYSIASAEEVTLLYLEQQ